MAHFFLVVKVNVSILLVLIKCTFQFHTEEIYECELTISEELLSAKYKDRLEASYKVWCYFLIMAREFLLQIHKVYSDSLLTGIGV